jgi:pyruvate,water dikinase
MPTANPALSAPASKPIPPPVVPPVVPPVISPATATPFVRAFADLTRRDVASAGGKGANLGELTAAGLPVPAGFVVTVDAYERFAVASGLHAAMAALLRDLDIEDSGGLAATAKKARELVVRSEIPPDVRAVIATAYRALGAGNASTAVAVRSSATAEDTAQFSFAGMHESFVEVRGEAAVIEMVRACWASAYHARAIYYRVKQGFPSEMGLAVVVQRMVDSQKSGVMFTADPATHDVSRIVIEAAWGLGEVVVGGEVTPDRYVLDKNSLRVLSRTVAKKEFMLEPVPSTGGVKRIDLQGDPRSSATVLTDAELQTLGSLARQSEAHYRAPQDLEFAIDADGHVFLTQTRPITTLGREGEPAAPQDETSPGAVLVRGLGASPGVGSGKARVLDTVGEAATLEKGEVLVTRMTSPDWVPIMRRSSAIVTDAGGMTSHAAIVARELGLPCIVGTHDATRLLATGTVVTVDGGAGTVVAGIPGAAKLTAAAVPVTSGGPAAAPVTATRLYVNLAEPDRADEVAQLDVDGVGLLRAEFMMVEALENMHPRAFLAKRSADEFVSRMTDRLRVFARAFSPRPVIYRAMDFRSNEFRNLTGGDAYEPTESNPMIGYRGCFRYTREPDLFALELRAIAEVRRDYENLHLMIPFVRTAHELTACLRLVDASALGADTRLQRWIMAEVPSVVYWLPRYAAMGITGVSIGSNDLTQLMLGVDRDSELFGLAYDERDGAVLHAIKSIITECRKLGLTCSICGQAPSVHPEYAERLVEWGIDSISVNVDAIGRTRHNIAVAERKVLLDSVRGRATSEG